MKFIKYFIFLLLTIPVAAIAQPSGSWPVSYGSSAPSYTPSSSGTRLYFNTATNELYTWQPAPTSSWIKYPKAFDQISGCAAPAYTPTARQSTFAVNSCTPKPELYQYTGSSWACLNCYIDYVAGTGIDITGSTISNTGDLSNTNELQNLSLSGQSLSISSGTGVTLPVVGVTAGTGISVSASSGNYTVSNTGDLSATNEIQTLSLSGSDLTLSDGGGTVTLPGAAHEYADAGCLAPTVVPDPIVGPFLAWNTDCLEQWRWNGLEWVIDGSPAGTFYTTSQFAGNGESGTPLALAQNGASTGQVMKWNGTVWAPGTDATGGGGGISDGNKTDITVAGSGDTLRINAGAVTGAKMAQDGATLGDRWVYNGDAWIPASGENPFRYWLSPLGSNSNSGFSAALPKQTIAGLSGLLTSSKSIGLRAGYQWREQITGAAHNLTVGSYSRTAQNPFAVINGSDVQTSWTTSGSHYNKSISHSISPINGYDGIVVMEIDTAMEKYAPLSAINYLQYRPSTASVDSFPGSFYYTNANPSLVSIRPTSGAPGSNKYRYEVTTRMAGILDYGYDNLNVSNVWFKSSGAGYGPIQGGDNTVLNNVIISGGGTHHFVIKSGNINNVLFARTAKGLPTGSTPATFYEVSGTGNVSTVTNSIWYKTQNAFIAHTSGAGNHRKITLDNNYFFGDTINYPYQIVIGGDNLDSFAINRLYVENVGSVGGVHPPYFQVRNSVLVNLSRPAWLFNTPSDTPRKVVFDNIFYKTYSHSGNQNNSATGFAGFLYKPNLKTKITIQNSTFHIKSTSTVAVDNNAFNGANTILNCIVIADQAAGRVTRVQNHYTDTVSVSDYNVYIRVSGAGFGWLVPAALNGGNPNVTSLATWQSVTGFDAHSIYIDLSSNPLGLRAVFTDPDGGNYNLLPGGQYTAQIQALKAGMTTPLSGWVKMPTEEQAADAVMAGTVPVLLDWKQNASGSPYNVPTNYVKWAPSVLHANNIPYATSFNTIQDTSLFRYVPGTGLSIKGGSNSTGRAFSVRNADNITLIRADNDGNITIGRDTTTFNSSAIVNLVAVDGSNYPNSAGVRLHSHQNGSVSPPNLTWSRYVSGTYLDLFQMRGAYNYNAGFYMRSPSNGALWFAGGSVDNTTSVSNITTNLPALYPYCEIFQLPYFNKGTVVVGADLGSSNPAADGEIRSGQKNNTGVPYDATASNLTIKAGRGLGAAAAGKGGIYFTTPDAAATGVLQAYTQKGYIDYLGRFGIGVLTPSAFLHLKAGAAGAGLAPLKLTVTGAALLTTPERGTVEVLGNKLFYTDSTLTRRELRFKDQVREAVALTVSPPATDFTATGPIPDGYWRVPSTFNGWTLEGYTVSLATAGSGAGSLTVQVQRTTVGGSASSGCSTSFAAGDLQKDVTACGLTLATGDMLRLNIGTNDLATPAKGVVVTYILKP